MLHTTLPLLLALTQTSDAALRADGALVLGQSKTFELSAPAHAGRFYFCGLSSSVRPGIATSGGVIGLGWDPLLQYALQQGPALGLCGQLDAQGRASFELAVPNDPSFEGLEVAAAYAVIDPFVLPGIVDVSNTVERRVRASDTTPSFAAIDTVLESYSDSWLVKDGIAFVFVQNGRILHASAFGDIALDTRVPYASSTKWVSGAALMRAVDMGIVSLDDRLSDFLPSFSGAKSGITFAQAFSHTSGLPGGEACLGQPTVTLQQCAAAIGAGPLVSLPGTQFRYGGQSMQAAGAALEIASGRAFEAFVIQELCQPIGAHTFAYDGFGPTPNPRVAGGGKGTVLDYAPLLELALEWGAVDGRRILSTQSAFALVADQTAGAQFEADPLPFSVGYGVGGWVEDEDPLALTTRFSSPGAFGAYPWVDFELGYGAFVLVDRSTSETLELMTELRPLCEAIARQL
jgi:CubicO group peptidase (beta-lactamase class C family)